ncbi:ras-related protein Rab-39B-like [Lampetra fluviatilis]
MEPCGVRYQYSVIVLGDATVGKTALLRRFVEGTYGEESDPTVGVDFFIRTLALGPDAGRRVKVQLWDTAGQERFRSITRSYYQGAAGALLVYDVSRRPSYLHIADWLAEARIHGPPSGMAFVLVAHKCDLQGQRAVSREEGERFASAHGMAYVEATARRGVGVEEAFVELVTAIHARTIALEASSSPSSLPAKLPPGVRITERPDCAWSTSGRSSRKAGLGCSC